MARVITAKVERSRVRLAEAHGGTLAIRTKTHVNRTLTETTLDALDTIHNSRNACTRRRRGEIDRSLPDEAGHNEGGTEMGLDEDMLKVGPKSKDYEERTWMCFHSYFGCDPCWKLILKSQGVIR